MKAMLQPPAIIIAIGIAVHLLPSAASGATGIQVQSNARQPLSANQIRQDLNYLVDRLRELHPAPFRRVGEGRFTADVAALETSLEGKNANQAIVGIMRIVASLRDGHTSVPFVQPGGAFRRLPLRFFRDDQGLHLTGADRRYAEALGGRLLAIGETPAAEVERLIRSITPGDNEHSVTGRMPAYMVVPELLAGLGIIDDPSRPVPVTVERGGRRVRLLVSSVATPAMPESDQVAASYSADWIDVWSEEPPKWLSRTRKAYWFEHDAATGTMFVQYNSATSDPADPMPGFARRLRAAIAETRPERVVLDLRLNAGGEGFWNRPLFLALLKSDLIEAPGKLFVLIGRQTFSAATLMATELEKYSNAIFVGEPTGGALQPIGNHVAISLPNSGLRVMVATRLYQSNGPHDDRLALNPSVAAPLQSADFAAGRDPALAAVLAYRPPIVVLREMLAARPASEASHVVAEFRSARSNRYLAAEPVVTGAGYELIRAGDFVRAVAVMRVAAADFPDAANAHDSLGDALRAAGDRAGAIAAYQRALAIDPAWPNARESLRALGVEPPPLPH